MNTRVTLFSRGRGHGHAIRDLALCEAVSEIATDISVTFVSYSTGSAVFRRSNVPFVDLNLPEANPFVPTLLRAHDLLQEDRPNVVVSHEEFAAIAAAKLLDLPCVYLSSWLPPPSSLGAECLSEADSALIFSDPGIFPDMPGMKQPPQFTGPLLRAIGSTKGRPPSARQEMGIPETSFVVTVVPGGWANEERCPLAPILLPAFARMKLPDRKLVWLAGDDTEAVRAAAANREGVVVLPFTEHPDQMMAESNLIITKGNRGATFEAEELGVPSISISYGTNPVDDLLVATVKSNVALKARQLSWFDLGDLIKKAAENRLAPLSPRQGTANQRRRDIARRLAHEIKRLKTAGAPMRDDGAGATDRRTI